MVPNLTRRIALFTTRVLERISNLYSIDIIDRVFVEIENNQELYKEYNRLRANHSTINSWIGRYTRENTRPNNVGRVNKNPKSKLIKSYHELFFDMK